MHGRASSDVVGVSKQGPGQVGRPSPQGEREGGGLRAAWFVGKSGVFVQEMRFADFSGVRGDLGMVEPCGAECGLQ